MGKKSTNRHHILPRSRRGTFAKDNIKERDKKIHSLHHQLFGNKTPLEQIKQQLLENGEALTAKFKMEIMRVIGEFGDLAYKPGVKR